MGFARHVVITYLIRVLLIPVGVITTVVIARWLGPEGQGTFAAVGAFIGIAGMIGGFGLTTAVTTIAAGDPSRAPALCANARLTGLVSGCAMLAGLLGARAVAPSAFGGLSPALLLLAGVALPFNLAASQFQAVLLGLQRVKRFNLMEVLDRFLMLAAALTLVVAMGRGVTWLIAATSVIAVARFVAFQLLLGPAALRLRPDAELLVGMRGISTRAYLASLLSYLVLRSDLVLIQGMAGARATGVYSIAVQITDLLLVLPGAVGTLLFPRVAAGAGGESAPFTAAVCRHVALFATGGCMVAALTAWWVVPFLFGPAFRESTICLWLLLPGVWCMSLQLVLSNDLSGRDYPSFLPWTWAAMLALNVVLNIALIPRFGVAGAAAASTVAYAIALALVARYWLRRFPGIGAPRLFFIDAAELSGLTARVRRALLPWKAEGAGA